MCRHSQNVMPRQQSVAAGRHPRSILAREIDDAQRRVDYFGRRIELIVVPCSRHKSMFTAARPSGLLSLQFDPKRLHVFSPLR